VLPRKNFSFELPLLLSAAPSDLPAAGLSTITPRLLLSAPFPLCHPPPKGYPDREGELHSMEILYPQLLELSIFFPEVPTSPT
jgi:hypothetical protein